MAFSVSCASLESSHWQWQHWQNFDYLTCELLQPWSHGFFTQAFWPRSPQELTTVFSRGIPAFRLQQVHGNRVLTPSELCQGVAQGDIPDGFVQADGLLSDRHGEANSANVIPVNRGTPQAVWVASADCTPVLMGDLGSGRVAAIHAGWRGTAKRIVPVAITRLLSSGTALEDLRIALGPAITGDVYQVEESVAVEVGKSLMLNQSQRSSKAILSALKQGQNPPILADEQPGRVRLDVRRVIVMQLEQLGIAPEQMAIAPHCTFQQPEYFFSYRRSQQKKVQWSGIVSATFPLN